ncbi:MAG: hypothetical protein K8U03_25310 [Planctomycetia bacterium]|nr:hypothetical protein [Planctomycetia bacterium]
MRPYYATLLVLAFCSTASSAFADGADIRPEPGGKRLLFIDGDDIRSEPGGKRLLFIDDNVLRDAPGGKALLYFDDDDVRNEFGGYRILMVDDYDLRRKPGAKSLLYLDGDDIRDSFGGKRLLFVDGKVDKKQLLAALYVLMPDLFKLTPEEIATLKGAMAAARAEGEAAMSTVLLGKFDVLNSSVPGWGGGVVTTMAGKDGFHYLDMKLKGAELLGIGVKGTGGAAGELWIAFAPEGSVALAVYDIDGGKLTGKWVPINAAKDGQETLGNETLEGPASLSGEFKIVAAQAPNAGAKYAGTVTLKPYKPVGGNESDLFDLYQITWNFGATKIPGVAAKIKTGEGNSVLIAASGTKGDFAVGHIGLASATLAKGIDFVTNKGKPGYLVWTKQNE